LWRDKIAGVDPLDTPGFAADSVYSAVLAIRRDRVTLLVKRHVAQSCLGWAFNAVQKPA